MENSDGSVGSENEGSPVVESVKMKAHRSHSKAEPLLDHALQHSLQYEAPDTVNHGALDSLSGHGTIDSSSDQILKWSQTDSALEDESSVSDKEGEEEDRRKEEEEEEEKEKEKGNEEEEDEEEEGKRKQVREEADGSEGQEKEAEGMQYDQLKGECFLEENIDRSPSPVDSIPAGSSSPQVESSHMAPVSDSTQNFSFVEEPSTTTTHHEEPSTTMTHHEEPSTTMTHHEEEPSTTTTHHEEEPSTTTTHHEEPSTTTTRQPSNPFDQDFESPDDVYQLVPNPFDTFDEIDSICRDVTLKPAPTQENTLPNPFSSHSTDCSTSGDDPLGSSDHSGDRGLQYNDGLLKDSSLPGDTGLPADGSLPEGLTRGNGLLGDRGLWENDSLPEDRGLPGDRDLPRDRKLLEEEPLSNFAPDTTSYSSSLDLSCLLEATLDHSHFSQTNSPHLQFQEDHFPPEVSSSGNFSS